MRTYFSKNLFFSLSLFETRSYSPDMLLMDLISWTLWPKYRESSTNLHSREQSTRVSRICSISDTSDCNNIAKINKCVHGQLRNYSRYVAFDWMPMSWFALKIQWKKIWKQKQKRIEKNFTSIANIIDITLLFTCLPRPKTTRRM